MAVAGVRGRFSSGEEADGVVVVVVEGAMDRRGRVVVEVGIWRRRALSHQAIRLGC